MSKAETIQDIYKTHWLQGAPGAGHGQFNVLRLEPVISNHPAPPPYRRRDYYKISLLTGNCVMQYGDKAVTIKRQALVFTNPLVPYGWGQHTMTPGGFTCFFDAKFFQPFGELGRYAIFQSDGIPVFELTDEQYRQAASLYERMLEEMNTDYIYKYELLRGLVFELIHFALKLYPGNRMDTQAITGAKRISTLFLELLERQFPIDEARQYLALRSAGDYAGRLNIHVNYLNRSVKSVTGKTTTELIARRILQEAKTLLKNSEWNVSQVAYALGFTEVAHFNNFFKKHLQTNPLKFRNV